MDEPVSVNELTLQTDARPADWVVAAVRDFEDHVVGCLVPPVFGAYARVFHPARRTVEGAGRTEGSGKAEGSGRTGDAEGAEQEVTWTEVARANGRTPHPAMQWPSITGSWRFLREDGQPGIWDDLPAVGSLPMRQAARLVHLLSAYTTTPERCWFAVWEGFGDLGLPVGSGIARVEMPARSMLLLTGPLRAATTSLAATPWCDQRAGLWWPHDRAWCVATDVDLMTTYVGGGEACVAALVADEELEAMEVGSDQRLTWDSDPANPVPPTGDRY
ncbi:hypothetical protein [Streptosporangium sp. NPDC023615]|uniref:hypothetical protein n=1 Tax=Streptosporangium sp. NPDC023615 TaxID=3154794 RepID=UPI00344015D0